MVHPEGMGEYMICNNLSHAIDAILEHDGVY
jgi:hypothetical protein